MVDTTTEVPECVMNSTIQAY